MGPFIIIFALLTGKAVSATAQGGKDVVDASAGVIDAGLTGVQSLTSDITNGQSGSINSSGLSPAQKQKISLEQTLNSSTAQKQQKKPYESDDSNSEIQVLGKSGWCYVGTDRHVRSCAQVGVNDTCMSGDIFPSNEICMNPSLRA